eukprot:TCALIF_11078-PA protein Name:"Protein of unknown function" AED:0.17 eAED:0.17 QI:0/0/0.5/0.5/1/1/2/150/143
MGQLQVLVLLPYHSLDLRKYSEQIEKKAPLDDESWPFYDLELIRPWHKRGSSPLANSKGDLEVEDFLLLPPIQGPDAIAAQGLDPDSEQNAIQAFFKTKRVKSLGFKCSSGKVWNRQLRGCVPSKPNGQDDNHLAFIASRFAF